MDPSANEIAGVVDLFGAMTREELGRALAELAYKRGDEFDPEAFSEEVAAACRSFHLVSVPTDTFEGEGDQPLLVVGPVAFPELPEGGTDVPHIMDLDSRDVDRDAAVRAAEETFRSEAADAVAEEDEDRIAHLLDVSYELEAWGTIDLSEARAQLDREAES